MDVLDRKDLEMQLEHNNQETKVKTVWLMNMISRRYQSFFYGLAAGFLIGIIFGALIFGYNGYVGGYLSGIRNCTAGLI